MRVTAAGLRGRQCQRNHCQDPYGGRLLPVSLVPGAAYRPSGPTSKRLVDGYVTYDQWGGGPAVSDRAAGRTLVLLVAAYLVLGPAYSLVNPVFESPDESLHYANVRFLAEERRLPVLEPDEPTKAHHPPLYYVLGALLTQRVPSDNFDLIAERVNAFWIYRVDEYSVDNKNLYLHDPAISGFPYEDVVLGVQMVRWLSLMMGAGTLFLVYLTAKELLPRCPSLWVAVAALVAFNPMFLFVNTSVHEDVLANLVTAAILLVTARLMVRGLTVSRVIALGILTGLAILTKLTCLLITPTVGLAILWRLWIEKGRIRLEDVLRFGGIAILLALLIGGWWLARNQLVYGEPTSMERQVEAWGGTRDGAPNLAAATRELGFLHDSFWGVFGYGQIPMPGWTYVLYRLLGLAALGGLLRLGMPGRSGRIDHAARCVEHLPRGGLAILLSAPLITVVILFARMVFIDTANFGRYMFVSLGFLGPLYALGLGEWVGEKHVKRLSFGLAGALLLLAVFALVRVLHPAYAVPRMLAAHEVEARTQSTDLRFGDSIRLAGHDLSRPSTHPGGEIMVTLCWESVGTLDEDFVYFVHLVGPREMVVGARTTHPGLGRYPTSRWSPGDRFCDTLGVPVDDDTPAPAVYDVVIGWHQAASQVPLPAYAPDGSQLEWVQLDQLRVTPARRPSVAVSERIDADLAGEISLLGHTVDDSRVRPGDTLTVTLYWEAHVNPSADYTVFLHLAASDGALGAQDDGQPRQHTYPTSLWDAGEVVSETRTLAVPGDLPPGDYDLLVGMYLLDTGARLPTFDAAGERQPGDALRLAQIEVGP